MKLSEKESKLFYQLCLPLLDYVNQKYRVSKKLKNIAENKNLDLAEVKKVANRLWEETELIDAYLEECGNQMPEEHREILRSWKNCVQGTFILERHLKKGSIFISDEGKVYQVQGIISSWEEMFPTILLPVAMQATLIPFGNRIISDGVVMPYPVNLGRNMEQELKEIYMRAKKAGQLIQSLPAEEEGENMQNQKWKKFKKLTEKCYSHMIGAEKDGSCWMQAFALLKEIVLEERALHGDFAPQLEMLDDVTEYEYDIQGWLEDCMDELDMRGDHHRLLSMCDDLLELFDWPGYTGSDIRFLRASALGGLGRKEERAAYCRAWIEQEPENIVAAAAGVYAFMKTKEFEAAEKLVDRFIEDKSLCTEDNDIMFTAASRLYEAQGKRKEKRQVDKAMEAYEKEIQKYFAGEDFDEDDFDDEWPFF